MTSRTIKLLDDSTINQIAAGEVIENSASVIKELVENSLDSGASEIHIETKAGGRSYIKVSDDGCGMSQDDLLLAIERHATSKLSQANDLERLLTLGFRGEALPSIAAVSKFSIHSSQGISGALLHVEGGKLGQLQPLPRRQGTTIEVKSLFFNTPVRKHFQKSSSWDTAEIHKVLTRFCLSFPGVGFSWVSDERLILNCRREETFQQRIASLLGEEWITDSVEVVGQQGELHLAGLIGRPSWHRPNRSGQYLFINQRSIVSGWISSQVLDSYGTRLSCHRYPLFVLYLTLPPNLIDVNVHPQKREVRLREEGPLSRLIHHSIQSALESRAVSSHNPLPALHAVPSFEPTLMVKDPESIYALALDKSLTLSVHEPVNTFSSSLSQDPVLFEEQAFSIIAKQENYFFVEEAQGIRVVDGLRAMERVVFDGLHVAPGKQEVQTLLIPIQLNIKGKDATLLSAHLTTLNELGLSIRHFGGDTYLVDAIPAILEPQEIPEWVVIFLEEGKIPLQLGKCLKRGSLSIGAGAALVKKLFQCQNPDYTPSGKLIHYLLDSKYLERLLA